MRDNTLAIGITTKDRWHDLAVTLDRLRENGLHRFETIVIDDGSIRPMPHTFRERFNWIKFQRFESSQGYIVQRNRLAGSAIRPTGRQVLTTTLTLRPVLGLIRPQPG